MISKNKLDKLFNPGAIFGGYFMILAGIAIVVIQSVTGLILVVLGAFISFTSTSAIIDSSEKKVKSLTSLFGLIPTGKWLQIKPGMQLKLKNSNRSATIYSRSNRSLELNESDIRLVLLNRKNKELAQLKKYDDIDVARQEIENFKQELGIG